MIAAMTEPETVTIRLPKVTDDVLQYGSPPRPACWVHGCEMRDPKIVRGRRYWYCQVPECGCSYNEPSSIRRQWPREDVSDV